MRVQAYEPKKKFKLSREGALPVLLDVGSRFATFSAMACFFMYSFVVSMKTFFKTKKNIKRAARKLRKKKKSTLDLR